MDERTAESWGQELAAFLREYDEAHRDRTNRLIHHFSHGLSVYGGFLLLDSPPRGAALIAISLPISWTGHWVFERNQPAFFGQPERPGLISSASNRARIALGGVAWSAACFFRMLGIFSWGRAPT